MEEQTLTLDELMTMLRRVITGSSPYFYFHIYLLICYTLMFSLTYYYHLPLTQHKLVRKDNYNIWLLNVIF